MFQLGDFCLTTISGGRFRIDGGTMFGIVPRALWSRLVDVDERNTIAQATNCLLIQTPQTTVLIDTGYGSHLGEKQRQNFAAESGNPLLESLAAAGVEPGDVDTVVLTHLHFDHAGGCVLRDSSNTLVPAFPNAAYVMQRGEWELATAGVPELRNAYPQDNLLPLERAGCLRLIGSQDEILPGIRPILTPGHTEFHQSIRIESDGQVAVYLGDLCPSSNHLPTMWCMSYDTHMIETRKHKPQVLGEIADNKWLALFDHDPRCAAARIARDDRRDFVTTETIEWM